MKKLFDLYRKYSFEPGLIGLLINPYYLVRTSIYYAIQRNAHVLRGRLLDFGCGHKPYAHLFTVDTYIGLDVDQPGHDHTAEPVDVYYDGKNIPFEENYFDSCFSSQVFEHVFDLEYSLKEIHRVLKPGGTGLFLAPFVWEEHEVPFDFGRYSSYGLIHLFKKHGFEIVKRETDSHFARVLVQLGCSYWHDILPTQRIKYVNVVLNIFLVFPFMLVGLLLQAIAPRHYGLYFNNVIVARKLEPAKIPA